jgi:hypothetical protein
MLTTKKIITIFTILVIITSSTAVSLTLYYGKSKLPADLSPASNSVIIDGRVYTLAVDLWRDFMPPVEPDGTSLMVAVYILVDWEESFPDNINAEKIWIINGEEIWFSMLEDFVSNGDSHIYKKRADGGPKWGPGIEVDVVVELRTSIGEKYYLTARNQPIEATY